MAALGSDGTVVLSADDAARLRDNVDRWMQARDRADSDVHAVLVELASDLRNLLAGLPAGWGG